MPIVKFDINNLEISVLQCTHKKETESQLWERIQYRPDRRIYEYNPWCHGEDPDLC